MEQQLISSFYARTELLLSNRVLPIQSSESLAFFLEAGDADVFYVEKLSIGQGRRLFLCRINAQFLIPCFRDNDFFTLVINALTDCTVGIIDSESLNKLLVPKPDFTASLLEKWFLTVSAGLNHFGKMPLLNGLTKMQLFSADPQKSYNASNPDEVLWIEASGLKPLYYNFAAPLNFNVTLLPLTSNLWMSFGSTTQKTIFSTNHVIAKDEFQASLFGFNEMIITILRKLYTEEQELELTHVKDTYAFRNNAIFNAFDKFKSIIFHKTTDDFFSNEKLQGLDNKNEVNPNIILFQTCQLIGKEEKIEFVDPGNRISGNHDYLWNILRASNIRSRVVHLEPHWYSNNAGSMLGFLKSDKTPVGLIAKGDTDYWMIDLKNRKKVVVSESVNKLLEPRG